MEFCVLESEIPTKNKITSIWRTLCLLLDTEETRSVTWDTKKHWLSSLS